MIAIKANNLSKKFKLYSSPKKRLLEYLSLGRIKEHADFWALKDISFEIPTGTTVGIMGQNGSGKSTLLSILAGVLPSSGGSCEVNGRVSAILELGSGFHPEFTGRDNVYMYGSIIGLSKEEIDEKFDEILHFSELWEFIDQPLRTYSSGMIVRLAFSVAVNVNSDILIVDEALAVGDAIFQHRCFRKIREMQGEGKTILYVGHDTEAVRNLCNYAMLLDGGKIIDQGDANTVVKKYYALIAERERNYHEVNFEPKEEIIPNGYETIYDFVEKLASAKKKTSHSDSIRSERVEIKSKPRTIIFAHPNSEIEYALTIEPGVLFSFAIGLLPFAWDKMKIGVKFDIIVNCNGLEKNIFSKVLEPGKNPQDKGWHNFKLVLEDYYGKNVKIVFLTSGTGKDLSYCLSAWGWPNIIKLKDLNNNENIISTVPKKIISNSEENWLKSQNNHIKYGNKKAEIIKLEILDKNSKSKIIFDSGELAIVKVQVKLNEKIDSDLTVGFVIRNKYGDVYGLSTKMYGIDLGYRQKNDIVNIEFRSYLKLGAGIYSLTNGVSIVYSDNNYEVLDRHEEWAIIRIEKTTKNWGFADLDSKIDVY